MDVPVELRAGGQGGIGAREEDGGEKGGNDGADEMIGEGGEEEFVDMKREGLEAERGCERGDELL